jgi:acyl dehydratase
VPAVNPALEGKKYSPVEFVVDEERVRAFGLAVLAPEGLGVPPTFATVAEFLCFPSVIADPALELDFSRVIHAEQEYEWARPLSLRETLSATCRIASIRSKGGHGLVTLETTVTDADGATVVVGRATLVERGA